MVLGGSLVAGEYALLGEDHRLSRCDTAHLQIYSDSAAHAPLCLVFAVQVFKAGGARVGALVAAIVG